MHDLPDDDAMVVLCAICIGEEFVAFEDTGRMAVLVNGSLKRLIEITGEQVDDFLRRGWIEVQDDRVIVTEKGNYWARRWRERKRRAIRRGQPA